MNVFYLFAVLFAALAALFGFMGSQKDSKDSGKIIEDQISSIGNEIETLKESLANEESVKFTDIEESYRNLVDEFFKSKHELKSDIIATVALEKSNDIKVTQEYSVIYRNLLEYLNNVSTAYNEKLGEGFISIDSIKFPETFFPKRKLIQ